MITGGIPLYFVVAYSFIASRDVSLSTTHGISIPNSLVPTTVRFDHVVDFIAQEGDEAYSLLVTITNPVNPLPENAEFRNEVKCIIQDSDSKFVTFLELKTDQNQISNTQINQIYLCYIVKWAFCRSF